MTRLKDWEDPASAGNSLKAALWTLLLIAVVLGAVSVVALACRSLITPYHHPAPAFVTQPK